MHKFPASDANLHPSADYLIRGDFDNKPMVAIENQIEFESSDSQNSVSSASVKSNESLHRQPMGHVQEEEEKFMLDKDGPRMHGDFQPNRKNKSCSLLMPQED